MANTIILGLLMVTLLSLVIIPVVYELLEGSKVSGEKRAGKNRDIRRKRTHRFLPLKQW